MQVGHKEKELTYFLCVRLALSLTQVKDIQ